VHRELLIGRQFPDVGGGQAGGDNGAVIVHGWPGAGPGERCHEPLRRGRHDADGVALMARHEVVDAGLGNQGAATDDDEPFRCQCHLVDQMARDEHRAALGGQVPQQVAYPAHAFGVEAVDRLVEEQHPGISEERAGDAEPLPHPQGEFAGPAVRHRGEPDDVQHGLDPSGRDVVGLGQPAQMIPGAPTRVEGLGFQQRTHLAQRPGQLRVGAAVDERRSGIGPVEPENHAQGGGFP
jgi:hypothetical protein